MLKPVIIVFMELTIILSHIILGLIVRGIICYRAILDGEALKCVCRLWVFDIAYSLLLSTIVYDFVYSFNKELAANTLPEGNSVVAATVMGWLPALILTKIALWFRPCFLKKKNRPDITHQWEDELKSPPSL